MPTFAVKVNSAELRGLQKDILLGHTVSFSEPIVPFLFFLQSSFSTTEIYFPSILTNAKLTLLCVCVFTEGMEIFGSNQDRKSSHFFHFFRISYCLCLSDTISYLLLESMQRQQLTIVVKEESPSWKIWSILVLDRKQRMGGVKIAGPPRGWSWIRRTKRFWMGRSCLSFPLFQRKAEIMKVCMCRKCWWLFMNELMLCSLHVECILSIFIC